MGKIICNALCILCVLFLFNGLANGQSIVYLLYTVPPVKGGVLDISFNGEEVFNMYRNTKKICYFNTEENLIITYDGVIYNGFGTAFYMFDELQLQLSKNSVHYLKISRKGLNDLKIEELTEKDGKKEYANKKYKESLTYTEPGNNYFASVQIKEKSNAVESNGRILMENWRNKIFEKISTYNNGSGNNWWYKGQLKNKKRNGMGIQKFPDGNIYIGNWLNEEYNGYGITLVSDEDEIGNCPDCKIFVGYREKVLKTGIGACYDKYGNLIYYGNFKDNAPVDKYPTENAQNDYSSYKFLFYTWENGDMYLGETKNGVMTGYGIYVWENGNARFGNFINDSVKGITMFLNYKSEWEKGNWRDDKYAVISSSLANSERSNINSQARSQAFSQAMIGISNALNNTANIISQSQGSASQSQGSANQSQGSAGQIQGNITLPTTTPAPVTPSKDNETEERLRIQCESRPGHWFDPFTYKCNSAPQYQ